MPLFLDTPFNPGDIDPGVQYTLIIVTRMEVDLRQKYIRLVVERGYMNGADLKLSEVTSPMVFMIKDDEFVDPPLTGYSDIVTTMGVADELVYDQVAGSIYQWLIDEGHFSGIVV